MLIFLDIILNLKKIQNNFMAIYEEIKYLLAKEHTTLTSVANELKLRKYDKLTLSNLSRKIRNRTIKFEEVREIANILGYKINFEKNN